MKKEEQFWRSELVELLSSAGKKTGNIFEVYMRLTGLTKARLYNIAKETGWIPKKYS